MVRMRFEKEREQSKKKRGKNGKKSQNKKKKKKKKKKNSETKTNVHVREKGGGVTNRYVDTSGSIRGWRDNNVAKYRLSTNQIWNVDIISST